MAEQEPPAAAVGGWGLMVNSGLVVLAVGAILLIGGIGLAAWGASPAATPQRGNVLSDQIIVAGLTDSYGYTTVPGICCPISVQGDTITVRGNVSETEGRTFNFYVFGGAEFTLYSQGQAARPFYSAKAIASQAFTFTLTSSEAGNTLYFVAEKTSLLETGLTVRTNASAAWTSGLPQIGPILLGGAIAFVGFIVLIVGAVLAVVLRRRRQKEAPPSPPSPPQPPPEK